MTSPQFFRVRSVVSYEMTLYIYRRASILSKTVVQLFAHMKRDNEYRTDRHDDALEKWNTQTDHTVSSSYYAMQFRVVCSNAG